jgi:hypothetical protein
MVAVLIGPHHQNNNINLFTLDQTSHRETKSDKTIRLVGTIFKDEVTSDERNIPYTEFTIHHKGTRSIEQIEDKLDFCTQRKITTQKRTNL